MVLKKLLMGVLAVAIGAIASPIRNMGSCPSRGLMWSTRMASRMFCAA